MVLHPVTDLHSFSADFGSIKNSFSNVSPFLGLVISLANLINILDFRWRESVTNNYFRFSFKVVNKNK